MHLSLKKAVHSTIQDSYTPLLSHAENHALGCSTMRQSYFYSVADEFHTLLWTWYWRHSPSVAKITGRPKAIMI